VSGFSFSILELWMRVFKGLRHEFTPPFPVFAKKIVVSDISKIKNLSIQMLDVHFPTTDASALAESS
jgi:hypothetical protein